MTANAFLKIFPEIETSWGTHSGSECVDAPEIVIPNFAVFARHKTASQIIYHELPWSIGLMSPVVLNERGEITSHGSPRPPDWYSSAIQEAFKNSKSLDCQLEIEKRYDANKVAFVNCLMPYHGDCVSLLLRTSCLKSGPYAPIALVPKNIARLVPKWFSEVWTINYNRIGAEQAAREWNWELSEQLNEEFKRFQAVYLPTLFQPASLPSASVSEFFGIEPFTKRKSKSPTVVFLYREERMTPPEIVLPRKATILLEKTGMAFAVKCLGKILHWLSVRRYLNWIAKASSRIARTHPDVSIHIIGRGLTGTAGRIAQDSRVAQHTAESDRHDEKLVASADVLISAHGSHLVALSSLPGCVIQLIPAYKWANWNDALTMRDRDDGGWVNYLGVPQRLTADDLAAIVSAKLTHAIGHEIAYSPAYAKGCTPTQIAAIRHKMSNK